MNWHAYGRNGTHRACDFAGGSARVSPGDGGRWLVTVRVDLTAGNDRHAMAAAERVIAAVEASQTRKSGA